MTRLRTDVACMVSVCICAWSAAPADPPASASDTTAAAQTTAAKTAASATSPDEHLAQLEKQLRTKGYTPRMMRGAVFFCRREVPLGSHLASEYNCVSVAGAERIASGTREDLESMQRKSGTCLMMANKVQNCGQFP
jgi:hypothetical protein